MRRLATAVAAAVTLLLAPAGTSLAQEPEARITGVQVQDSTVQVGFATPAGTIDPQSVVLTLDGQEVAAEVESLAAAQVQRTAMLTIDASNSMRGEPITNAKAAAQSFLQGVPDETLVGLVTFNRTATVDVAPTLDRAQVSSAIDAITLQRKTALYDGVIAAVDAAGTQGFRSIVLLSDGRNVGGTATLDEAVQAVQQSGLSVEAVALGAADVAALTQITDAGNGSVLPAAQASDLGALFEEQRRRCPTRWC
jgi:tight adherence protein B